MAKKVVEAHPPYWLRVYAVNTVLELRKTADKRVDATDFKTMVGHSLVLPYMQRIGRELLDTGKVTAREHDHYEGFLERIGEWSPLWPPERSRSPHAKLIPPDGVRPTCLICDESELTRPNVAWDPAFAEHQIPVCLSCGNLIRDIAGDHTLHTYLAWLRGADGKRFQVVLLDGFATREGAQRKLDSYLTKCGIAPSEVELQSDPPVFTGGRLSSFLTTDPKACVVKIADAYGKHLETIILEEFPHGEAAFQGLRTYLREERGLDPDTMRLELIEPVVITGPE